VAAPEAGDVAGDVRDFHRRLPGYAPTRVHELPELAAQCGVGRVLVKAEVERMGLPSFKVLGASWATYRLLCQELGVEPGWSTPDDLADVVARQLGPLRLVTATDGNHGRAVAFMARLLRLAATVLVPEGTVPARIEAIAGEGAEVLVVAGTYDDAVAASVAFTQGDDSVRREAVAVVGGVDVEAPGGAAERRLGLSDTAWSVYEEVPRWVIQGYATIFAELDEQLGDLGLGPPDAVVVPLGVGALGAAAAMARKGPGILVGVEPTSAACVAAAVEAGHVVEVPGPHGSIMAGLNCGLASAVALPHVAAGFDAFVAVDDDRCRSAIRALAAAGIDVGETGAAALAGLTTLVDDHEAALPLHRDATVLLLATEGVTDPVGFQAVVGRLPEHQPT
jgi:diaminopropionate ammonia-lyase